MKRIDMSAEYGFRLLANTGRSQAATMVLAPGTSTGGAENRHEASDQWMFVIGGRGKAVVSGKEVYLNQGDLLMIEAGETHEISNVGRVPFETLNFYAPPAYSLEP
jgi:mannose-6-phosphate isomerase-like protein (cupin superfamily)